MTEKPVEEWLPALGAFPGYKFGRSLFVAWMNVLEEQANIWNESWSRLASGDYELKDFYRALGKSVEASAAGMEQLRLRLASSSSPPWVTLPWPPGGGVPVRFKKAIDANHQLSAKLHLLGEKGGNSLEASVKVTGASTATITLKPGKGAAEGAYFGFVVSDRCSEPLAIVTVLVTKAPSTR